MTWNNLLSFLDQKEVFNFKGESLGLEDKLALHFSPSIGRRRIYRDSMEKPQKGMRLLIYKRRSAAEKICREINQAFGGL